MVYFDMATSWTSSPDKDDADDDHVGIERLELTDSLYRLKETYSVCDSTDSRVQGRSDADDFSAIAARRLVCSSNDNSDKSLAALLTNNDIHVYRLGSGLKKTQTLKGHTEMITGTKFSYTDTNLLYSSSLDGTLRIWDLRQSKEARKLSNDSGQSLKPFCSFDVNCDDTYACCGTELIKQDAFLLFWDLRSSKLLGGYWESHTDDITAVCFNPADKNSFATGSVDGLINIFAIDQPTEDDALINTLNTESSVEILKWYPKAQVPDQQLNIACLTQMETLQLWDVEQVSPLAILTREEIASTFQLIKPPSFVSLEVGHKATLGVVSSSNKGDVFLTEIQDNKPNAHSVLCGGHTKPLSAAFWDTENLATTCDDDGNLCLWMLATTTDAKNKNNDIVVERRPRKTTKSSDRWKPY